MTKDDLIWVVIRGAGFVLLIMAILSLPAVVNAITWHYYAGDIGPGSSENGRMFFATMRTQLISSVVYAIVYGALGAYLLRGGAWIHRLLRYVSPERSNTTPHVDARDAASDADSPAARAGGRER